MGKEMRLDKFLTQLGQGSRSQIRDMARRGRIQVNGQTEKRPDLKVNPDTDQVSVDGQVIAFAACEYFMINKPQGVVSATEDSRYPVVVDLILDKKRKDLFPVGRLDLDTEGLLLITNDGALAHRLLSPARHVDKVYFVLAAGPLKAQIGGQFAQGMTLGDGTALKPSRLERLDQEEKWRQFGEYGLPRPGQGQEAVLVTIQEGKFHQVKRMFEAAGSQVLYLKRLAMGPLWLDKSLAPGQYRPLSEKELLALRQETERKQNYAEE